MFVGWADGEQPPDAGDERLFDPWGLVDKVAPEGGLDAEVEQLVTALLECGPEALRSQKALLRQWEELPLTESVNLSVKVFGESFLTDEPTRLMGAFVNRKRLSSVFVPASSIVPSRASVGSAALTHVLLQMGS